jgi:hypothetical protein
MMATEGRAARPLKTPPPRRQRDADDEPPRHVTEPIDDDQAPPEHTPGNGAAVYSATHQRAPEGFQTPPHDALLEARLLGVLMVRNDALALVRDRLRPEHFYEPGHASYYREIKDRILQGRLADVDAMSIGKGPDARDLLYRVAQYAVGTDNEEVEQTVNELIGLWQRREQAAIARDLSATANDLTVPAAEWRHKLTERLAALEAESPQRRAHPCDLAALDWSRIANEEPPKERWLIDEWIPLGTSGIITGPGNAGKSFLELIRLICFGIGRPFLGHYRLEPISCIGYFAEDSQERLWSRARKICAGLQVDPMRLAGKVEIISTVGAHRNLLTSDQHSPTTTPTEWMHEVHDRARAFGAQYVSFDHVGRYLAINRNDPNQVFSAFGHLDAMAQSIDGSLGFLAHPSKTDLRNKAKQGSPIVAYVGGCAAMIDAPRWVEVLETVNDADGEKYRILTNEKSNYSRRFAAKCKDNINGIMELVEEVDPDNPGKTGDESRGRPSSAERTFRMLEELFHTYRRSIPLDDLVEECIKRGIIGEASKDTTAWRGRRRTVREHLSRFNGRIDEREQDHFAIRP